MLIYKKCVFFGGGEGRGGSLDPERRQGLTKKHYAKLSFKYQTWIEEESRRRFAAAAEETHATQGRVEASVFRRREPIDPLLEERRRDVRSCLGDMNGNLSGGGAQVPVTVRRRYLQLEQAW